MKKKRFGIAAYPKKNQRVFEERDSFSSFLEPKSTVGILEDAWKNLPSDFTSEERIVFLEVAEHIIKYENTSEIESDFYEEDITIN